MTRPVLVTSLRSGIGNPAAPSGRNGACGRERLRFAFRSDCHFPLQDDVRRHSGVGMIRIEGVRPVLPYVGCAKAFTVQFVFPISYIHKSVTFQLVAMPVKL